MLEFLKKGKAFFCEPKHLLLAIAGYCAALLVFALVLVRIVDLVPCPLCIVQRFFYAFIGIVALVAGMRWWPALSEKIAGWIIAFLALSGGAVALRQVWMQRFPAPEASTDCIVSFGSFLDDVILALGGAGNCAIIDWTWLTLSIADWSLIAFTLIGGSALWMVREVAKRERVSVTIEA